MSLEQQQQDLNNPVRNLGIPQNPVPQTNSGLLEHTGIPLEPFEPITDIPPSFSWMCEQWKYVGSFIIRLSDTIGSRPYDELVVSTLPYWSKHKDGSKPCWTKYPFSASTWWTGTMSYRFMLIKPPRVTGKLLVRYRQDAFGTTFSDAPSFSVNDKTYRSILKEWDLSQSSIFEFDIQGVLPIRARPTKLQIVSGADMTTQIATSVTPWCTFEMGRIQIEIAQVICPGGIFPDEFTCIVQKSIKNPKFFAPTDPRQQFPLVIGKQNELPTKK